MAKTFDELTIMDDYMFAQVMRNKKYLCPLLEHILGMKIVDLKFVEPQKTEKEGYESKGVRLDIYVESEDGTIYDVEVQTTDKRNLPKRMRFYQSIMDINFLNKGMDYNALKASYVIFICSYDEVGLNRCVSLFENICRDVPDKRLGDEAYKVIVYTRGNPDGISEELKEALRYLDDGSVTGAYSKELDDAVRAIKASEERRKEYMDMLIRDNEKIAEGFEKGREETLVFSIKSMMKNLGLSVQKALDALGITDSEERTRLAGMIQ